VEISDGTVTSLYHFDNDGVDATGNGKNLTGSGVTYIAGLLNESGDTQGTGYWTGTSTLMDIDGDYTIGFWLNAQAGQNDKRWISRYQSGVIQDGVMYGSACAANHAEFLHNYNTQACDHTAMTVNSSQWYYMLITRTNGQTTWYQNDTVVFSFADNQNTNALATVYINSFDGSAYKGDFYIDELFFRTAYTDTSTRTSLYNGGAGDTICLTAGCADAPTSTPPTSNGSSTLVDNMNYADFMIDFAGFAILLGMLFLKRT